MKKESKPIMEHFICPVCKSVFAHSEDQTIGTVLVQRNEGHKSKDSYAPSARIKLMSRIIYLLIGALLALSGVSIKSVL